MFGFATMHYAKTLIKSQGVPHMLVNFMWPFLSSDATAVTVGVTTNMKGCPSEHHLQQEITILSNYTQLHCPMETAQKTCACILKESLRLTHYSNCNFLSLFIIRVLTSQTSFHTFGDSVQCRIHL